MDWRHRRIEDCYKRIMSERKVASSVSAYESGEVEIFLYLHCTHDRKEEELQARRIADECLVYSDLYVSSAVDCVCKCQNGVE